MAESLCNGYTNVLPELAREVRPEKGINDTKCANGAFAALSLIAPRFGPVSVASAPLRAVSCPASHPERSQERRPHNRHQRPRTATPLNV